MSFPANPSPCPTKTRVAYLLADGGIAFTDSRKGSSIHARSMCRALVQEGCEIKVYVLRKGDRPHKEFDVEMVRQSRLTRWVRKHLIDSDKLRRWILPGRGESSPNWLTALGLLLWQRDFYRHTHARPLPQTATRPDLCAPCLAGVPLCATKKNPGRATRARGQRRPDHREGFTPGNRFSGPEQANRAPTF